VSDTVEILKLRISGQIKASDERCIACQELLRRNREEQGQSLTSQI
jgi:hypothetical protein